MTPRRIGSNILRSALSVRRIRFARACPGSRSSALSWPPEFMFAFAWCYLPSSGDKYPLWSSWSWRPSSVGFQQSVCENDEFAHDGGDGDLCRLSGLDGAAVGFDQVRVDAAGDEGRHVERSTQPFPPTPDVGSASPPHDLRRGVARRLKGMSCRRWTGRTVSRGCADCRLCARLDRPSRREHSVSGPAVAWNGTADSGRAVAQHARVLSRRDAVSHGCRHSSRRGRRG